VVVSSRRVRIVFGRRMDFAGTESNASRRMVEDTNNSKDSRMVACKRRRRRRVGTGRYEEE